MGLKTSAAAAGQTTAADAPIEGEVVETVTVNTTAAAEPAAAEPAAAAAADESAGNEQVNETTAMATTGNNTQAMATASGKFVEEAASDGFEGLEIGFGSFPTVKLPAEGSFQLSEGEVDLGKSFKATIHSSREKFVFSNSDDEDSAEFSYDGVTIAGKGEPLAPIFAQWKAEGSTVEKKKYLECMATIEECESAPDLVDTMVLLSLPPTAVTKFSGYTMQLKLAKQTPRDVVTVCSVGPKVTTAKKPFYPWAFRKAQ